MSHDWASMPRVVTFRDRVHCSAKLKGPYALILFAFEVQVAARHVVERSRCMNRGAMGAALDASGGGSNRSEVGSVETG